jgi:magnesium transporter
MLRAYRLENSRLQKIDGDQIQDRDMLKQSVWVDLIAPDDDERERVLNLYKQDIPESDEVEEIEASARYFKDEQGLHIHSLFLYSTEGRYKNVTVACTLNKDHLFTTRDVELPDFRLLRMRARHAAVDVSSPMDIMMSLIETKVEHLADVLEDIYSGLEKVSHTVLEEQDSKMEVAIDQLAELEDSNGKVRLCLMDTQRSLSFLMREIRSKPEVQEHCREILRDIDSLLAHTNFLFDKVNFLMAAAQNFISIQQSQIIKIFSIVAVVFLPPTLIASIYGMNFKYMPELDWPLGYPLSLLLMVAAAISPYFYFKRKGWL